MGDWIGLGVILLLTLGGFLGLARLGRAPEPLTPEEFERRVQESRGWMSAGAAAGMHALQKLMNPKAAEAVEVLKDMRAGFYDDKEQPGDGDEDEDENAGEDGPRGAAGGPGLKREGRQRTAEDETDA